MHLELAMGALNSWIRIAELEPKAIRRLNEHYLHHWFTHEVASTSTPLSFANGTVHPEWPTRKLAHDREENITYRAEDCSYITESTGVRRGAGHIDFALGDMNAPEVLIEFKWNDAYDEWEFDFLKMMDPRLSAPHRICFGVLPRGWNRKRNDWVLDLDPLNLRLRKAVAKARHYMENSPNSNDLKSFTAHFFCVAVGVEGGTPLELLQAGVASLAHSRLSSADILGLPEVDVHFNQVQTTHWLSVFNSLGELGQGYL